MGKPSLAIASSSRFRPEPPELLTHCSTHTRHWPLSCASTKSSRWSRSAASCELPGVDELVRVDVTAEALRVVERARSSGEGPRVELTGLRPGEALDVLGSRAMLGRALEIPGGEGHRGHPGRPVGHGPGGLPGQRAHPGGSVRTGGVRRAGGASAPPRPSASSSRTWVGRRSIPMRRRRWVRCPRPRVSLALHRRAP